MEFLTRNTKSHLNLQFLNGISQKIDRTIVSVQKIEITAKVVAALVPSPMANKKKDKEQERQKAISFLMRIYYH